MTGFIIRFLFCNLFVCVVIGMLLTIKRLFKNVLTSRMQYHLWFLLFGLLSVPFIPVPPISFLQIISWFSGFRDISASHTEFMTEPAAALSQPGTANWMNDLCISFSQDTPSGVCLILYVLWILGILLMAIIMIKSKLQLNTLKKSALPLQNREVRKLYHCCLSEMNLKKEIPIYSTAFLKSPMIVGLFKPCIYLPIHLISDYPAEDIRYMLLHELQHYKSKDAIANYLMNLAAVIYWFNPFVWYARKEMCNDREIACDTSVLGMLHENSYKAYGNTLINFAQKVSFTNFPFASGISGSMIQMKKRILNIASYHPVTFRKKLLSIFSYVLIAIFLSGFIPVLSTQAAKQEYYYFSEKNKNISYIDLSTDFDGYRGSFVLYDTADDSWQIYNRDSAAMRISPASTYKIYLALSALEVGIITPEQSRIPWNGQKNVFDTWDGDQTLESAMQNSVNWYFQAIDREMGLSAIKDYVRKIDYGNQTAGGDISSYWYDSSLKISPIEQVEMLIKLYDNDFQFSSENIEAVKKSICLFSTADGSVYGKTGTEAVNGQTTSGWFIGFIETEEHTCFFAANIQDESNATGAAAAELTFSILSELNLWNQTL